MAVPSVYKLMNPALEALRQLGGSGSISEIEEKVIELMKLPDADVQQIHRGAKTRLSYRLAWARTYLKRFGLIDNSSRGVWTLTEKGKRAGSANEREIVRFVHSADRKARASNKVPDAEPDADEPDWKEQLIERVLKLSAKGFENLCQRILREAGFIRVEVTGRSGDGGIDGKGIMRMGGLLSFHIVFQCKRYSGSVSAKHIRDFRGAMVGRADKGLLITTGSFTREAIAEAARDGAPPIDLVDGEQLADKMRELRLGVRTRTQELVEVDGEWFKGF